MGKKKVRPKQKTMRKLLRKRQLIMDWLATKGVEVGPDMSELEVMHTAYRLCGQEPKFNHVTLPGAHSRYAAIMNWAGLSLKDTEPKTSLRSKLYWPQTKRTTQDAKKFYESYEWRKLRYKILQRDGARCQLCGAERGNGVVLHVDHIKPLRSNWHLRLEPDNLQVLCNVCNHGKGNWDETNWRIHSPVDNAFRRRT